MKNKHIHLIGLSLSCFLISSCSFVEASEDTTKQVEEETSSETSKETPKTEEKTEEPKEEVIPLQVYLDSSTYRVHVGHEKQLNVSYTGNSVTNPSFKWMSSNISIARIDQNGIVTGITEGQCEITVFYDVNNNSIFEQQVDIYAKASLTIYSGSTFVTNTKNVTYYTSKAKTNLTTMALPSERLYSTDVEISTIDGEGDIPYISTNSLHNLYLYQRGDFNQSNSSNYAKITKENGKYRLDLLPTNMYVGGYVRVAPLYFDIANNKITCENYTKFTSIANVWNNGLPNDMCSPDGIVKTSTTSKTITSPTETVFDLTKYNMSMYEISGVGYIPLHIALSLVNDFATFYYDGSIICDPSVMENNGWFSYLYSGKSRFTIELTANKWLNGSSSYYTFFQSKTDPNYYSFSYRCELGGTSYINGKAEFSPNTNKVTFTCAAANSPNYIAYNSSDGLCKVTYNYTKTNDLITITDPTTNKVLHYIRLTENDLDTAFKDNMRFFNYNFLVFKLDHYYGLKSNMNVTSFDTYFKNTTVSIKDQNNSVFKGTNTIYNLLMNTNDIDEYNTVIYFLMTNVFGDGHTSISSGSPFANHQHIKNILLNQYNRSTRNTNLNAYANQYSTKRYEANGHYSPTLKISGKTAIIQFDDFNGKYHYSGYYDAYIRAFSTLDDNSYSSNYSDLTQVYDTLTCFYYAFYIINKQSGIENIVFDLTINGGGAVLLIPQILAFMTKDPVVVYKDTLNNFVGEYHYQVDLDGDGTYASDSDTYASRYKFFILQSEFSFSCGSALPAVCKNIGCAKIIGASRSGGGACPVGKGFDAFGTQFRISSRHNIMLKNGSSYINNDEGVPADKTLSSEYWYNYSYLNNWLNSNF